MICNKCNKDVTKVDSGRKHNRGRKIYVDNNGHRWNGNECPACKYNRVSNVQVKRKAQCGHYDDTRYFKCAVCKPELETDTEYLYC